MSNKKLLINASLWVIGAFGLSQVFRLGGNLVVTRLLEPEMFGIMAIAFVVMQGLTMFSDLGFWAFIVRQKKETDLHILNTVWTMQVVRGWIMFLALVVMIIGFIAIKDIFGIESSSVYGEAVLPLILCVVGFTAVINGYKTMAPAVQSRELKRGKLELIELASQVSGISIMLIWAWMSPSIWALVSAGIVSAVVSLTLVYKVFPLRHQFAWDKNVVSQVFNFGKWIFLASVLTYFAQQGDRLFFGAYISPAQLGVYSIAFMLANTIIAITQQLSTKILFPIFSEAFNDKEQSLKSVYYRARLRLDALIYVAAGLLLALAPAIVELLYDERYIGAGWMLQILTVLVVGTALSSVAQECLSALGETKVRMQVMLVRSIGLLLGLPLCFYFFGFEGAVWAVAINVWLGLPLIYWTMRRNKVFSLFNEIVMMPLAWFGYMVGAAIVG